MSNAATGASANNRTFGSVLLTSAALFGPVNVGDVISGTGITSGATVSVKTDTSNITMSVGATSAGTSAKTFTRAASHTTGPHTAAEINAAFLVDFPILQTAAGATFSATHRQYLPAVTINFGHPTAGNSASTSFVDESGCDIFGIGTRLQWPNPNAATQTFIMGTKIGDGVRMAGKNGGSIHQSGAIQFRGTLALYGCFINGTGNIQFLNGTGTYQEVAGCTINTFGGTATYVLGNSDSQPFRVYNTNFSSAATGNVVASSDGMSGANNVLAATAPNTFFSSSSQNRSFSKLTLSGAPAVADIRMSTGATNWALADIVWSGTVGVPKVTTSAPLGSGGTDLRTFDTKVVDDLGSPLSGIPVYVESSYFGVILDDVTDEDGDVPFTYSPTAQAQVLPVREYYSPDQVTTLTQDATITMTVNGYGALNPPNPDYQTRVIVFTWPGRDRSGSGYVVDGGNFLPLLDVVQLPRGVPSTSALWNPCEVQT